MRDIIIISAWVGLVGFWVGFQVGSFQIRDNSEYCRVLMWNIGNYTDTSRRIGVDALIRSYNRDCT